MIDGTLEYVDTGVNSVRSYGFYRNKTIREIIMRNAKVIGHYAFDSCENLSSVEGPAVTEIGTGAFAYCRSFDKIVFPNLTTIGLNAFYSCLLTEFDFTHVTELGYRSFGINRFVNVVLPNQIKSFGEAFYYCPHLEKVDIYSAELLSSDFRECYALRCAIIRSGINPDGKYYTGLFKDTPIEDGNGFIYVHSEHLESYKTHEAFIQYAAQFRAIEDYPEITGG